MGYENLQQLLERDVVFVAESESKWFIRLRPEEYFDVSMWVVDKKSGSVSYIEFTKFLYTHLDKDAHEIGVDEFYSKVGIKNA